MNELFLELCFCQDLTLSNYYNFDLVLESILKIIHNHKYHTNKDQENHNSKGMIHHSQKDFQRNKCIQDELGVGL